MRRRQASLVFLAAAGLVAGYLPRALTYTQNSSPAQVAMPQGIAFRVLFGLTGQAPAVWDGKANVSTGKILGIRGWRFAGRDSTGGVAAWKASTRYAPANAGASAEATGPVLENGVLVTLSGEDPRAQVTVETPRGAFSFRPQDVVWGTGAMFLNRQARVAAPLQLTESPEERDFPALAQSVWLSLVEFVHGDRSQVVTGRFPQEPEDFGFLARPAGGDQVRLMRFSKSQRTWTGPLPVSDPGQDVCAPPSRRTASSSGEQRLTWDPGTDLNSVAATDTNGRVWIAWQAFRNNNLTPS